MEKANSNESEKISDGDHLEKNSDSESSEDESDSSFDEDDISEDFVPTKKRPRGRVARRGRRKIVNSSSCVNASSETSSNSSTRRTRLSQKIEEGIPTYLNSELQSAYRILEHLMSDANQSYNWPFMEEVDVNLRENRNYSVVIEKPMCLNTVKRKLFAKQYYTITDVFHDVRLIYENCYLFYGASHSYSKKGFRLEAMMEQKLTQLPRDARDKTVINVTSPQLVKGINIKELLDNAENRSPAEASMVMACVKQVIERQEEEDRKMLQKEKDEEKDPFNLEVLQWEKDLIGDNLTALKAMWELPQIGHFLFLAQDVLNIPEVSQFELERAFFMPQASSLLSTIMTALLSNPKQRNKLSNKPPMPYKIWHERLKAKLQTWYRLYYAKERNVLKVLNIIGIESSFFRIMGDINPLDKRPFHELEYFEKVWIVKSLCDFCLHSHKSVHEAIFMGDPLDHREVILGEDIKGNTYLHFPQFCGPDLRVYRQSYSEPSAPDLSCPPIVKDITVTKGTNESKEKSNMDNGNENRKGEANQQETITSSQEAPVRNDAEECKSYKCEKHLTNESGQGRKLCDNGLISMPSVPLVNGMISESELCSEKDANSLSDGSVQLCDLKDEKCVPNGEANLDTEDYKPKLIMKFKKEKCCDEDSENCDGNKVVAKRRKSKMDVFTICNSDNIAMESNTAECESKDDAAHVDEVCKSDNDVSTITRRKLRSATKVGDERENLKHDLTPGDELIKEIKLVQESEKQVDKPKKSPAKASDCLSLESTWIGSRRKGKRGRKSRATWYSIRYDGVASKPNIEEFELVVSNLDSLRDLTESFVPKEPPPQRTRRKKEPQQKSNACEKALHKRLSNLVDELNAWELTLLQSTKNARIKLKKEWDDYQIKATLTEEEECKDIWGSEDEEDIQESSSSSSNSEDEYEDLGDATSFRMQHLRQCTRRKRVRGEDDQNSISISSENSNSSDPFHTSVSSRGRIRKMRKLDYEDIPVHKVPPKPKRQVLVLNGIQPDQRNMLEAHRIQNSTQDAKMQYQWETMRQQLLENKLKKTMQKPSTFTSGTHPSTSKVNVKTTSNTRKDSPTTINATPRLLPHYGERMKTKSLDDTSVVAKDPGTPSYHLQSVLMAQPSFGSMKSMKSSLGPDESFFDDPGGMGLPPFVADFSSTNRPFVPPPQRELPTAAKKKAPPPPKIIRTESKNIGTRLLQTSYTAPGILKTTVGSKMMSSPKKETVSMSAAVRSPVKPLSTTTTTTTTATTVKLPNSSQVVRLQLPSNLQQKRVVLVPVKDQKGGNKYILKVYPTTDTIATSAAIASTSCTQVSQTVQSNLQMEPSSIVHCNSIPPSLDSVSQTFHKISPTETSSSPTKSSITSETQPLTLIVPQQTVSVASVLKTSPNVEIVNSPITSDVVFPTQQQVVISQPMVVPCAVQLQPSSSLLGQQHVVCTSDINGLLQFGKQLVITQPSSVATSNNIVLLTNNNQVISSTINMSGS